MKKLLASVALLLMPVMAHAAIIEFDDTLTQGGTIQYAGGNNPLVGIDIVFDQILGIDTPANNGVPIACTGCLLNFTSGNLTSQSAGLFEFAGGGSLTIAGQAGAVFTGTLAQGSFAAPVVAIGSGGNGLFIAGGTDIKPVELTNFYGLDNEPFSFVSSQLALGTCSDFGNGGFSCGVVNADFNNSQVPVPGTLLLGLMGIGLLGVSRRKETNI